MKIRQAICLLSALVVLGCGVNRYELYLRLPEQDKELFDRSKQFMTDRQQEKFLLIKDSPKRAKFVETRPWRAEQKEPIHKFACAASRPTALRINRRAHVKCAREANIYVVPVETSIQPECRLRVNNRSQRMCQ